MTEVPFVTIIVPVYNERDYIRECLSSLVEQDYPAGRMEILVADGLSNDGSREIVGEIGGARPAPLIRLLDNPGRLPASALNVGIREAHGEVILRLDAHARAAPDFVRQTVAALARSGAACVGGPIESLARGRTGRAIALAMSSPFGVGNALFRYAREEQYVDTVAFGAYPRRIFDEVGFYDETLVYSEDNEFNDRVRRHGGKILLTPAIRSYYYTRESLGALWRQYFNYGSGRARHALKNPGTIRPRHLVPLAFVTVLGLTALLGAVSPPFWWVLLAVLALYGAASLAFSLVIAARSGWGHVFILPAAFACQHFAYGLGMYAGLLRLLVSQASPR